MHLGSAWYPEHWPEERWPRDLDLMVAAGMTVVRMGEFAWSRLEPADGVFALDWLQRAVDLAAAAGLEVVLCTPTPTPPAWLTRTHPDILPVRDQGSGRRQLHGERGHVDPANAIYRRYSERICERLADRFASHPAVIGWQTDNEFWSIAANEATMQAFRAWLRARYGSLAELNETWSTSFWSQEYFAWEDVQAPLDYPNPGLYLDWYRFHSELTAEFQSLCIAALRRHAPPRQWITHNFHPYDDFDRVVLSEDLDLVSWDAYILPDACRLDPAANGCDCDRLRGIKRRNIWIMETLPGFVNWRPINPHLGPGESRAMAWHLIGHGADAILYWQWRSAPCSQEQYHGSLLQQDGEPRPVYAEIAAFGHELARLAPLLDGSAPRNDSALFDRWCDRQVLKKQRHHRDYEPRHRVADWYRAWQEAGHCLDVLERVAAPLDGYRLLLAPHLHLLGDDEAELLRGWVLAGGHLVLGPRSGMKDPFNRLRPSRQPGPLAGLLGATVREFYALPEPIPLVDGPCAAGEARIFAEWLEPTAVDCAVLARYGAGNGWLAGQAAVVSRPAGAGRITAVGCCGDAACHAAWQAWIATTTAIEPVLTVPPGVEVMRRWQGDEALLILVNHGLQAQRVTLPGSYRDHLGDPAPLTTLDLAPSGCAVLTAS